ncbi:class C sortase, partial [Klebsiella pneumoniae]|nr:class C sortase [Klebsiella pneumoniae]
RGLPSAVLFTDLDKLKETDVFYIHSLDKVLAYKVDQIKVVLPEETDDLTVAENEDYVTLITCTPYGVNTHRLLVRGHRVPYDKKEKE